MPIYEFECDEHGRFEEYHKTVIDMDFSKCPVSGCRKLGNAVPSKVSMHPDKHWNGTVTPTGVVVNSQKEYDDVMKNIVPYTRENKEFVEKQSTKRKQEHEEKKAQRRDKFFDKLAKEI